MSNYWSVMIDDVEDPAVIYSGRSMKEAFYQAGRLRGLDGRNCYVVYHINGAPAFYADEDDELYEIVGGVVSPFFK